MNRITAVVFAALVSLAACEHEQKFTETHILGGEEITPDILNEGRSAYMLYCYACHGENGDGVGPASFGYWPPPRDFRQATFKFAGVPEGELPPDDELIRIVHSGLNGTAMLPWEISHEELWLAIQYIKTFSPCDEWEERDDGIKKCKKGKGYHHPRKKIIEALTFPADPFAVMPRQALWDDAVLDAWIEEQRAAGTTIPTDAKGLELWKRDQRAAAEAKRMEAVKFGEEVYHAGGCQLCHPAYIEPEKIMAYGGTPRAVYPYDPDPKYSQRYEVVLVPPDFLRTPVRSPKQHFDRGGKLRYDAVDFYRVISSGIPGTAMPSWAALPPDRVWAVAYYAAWLSEQKNTPEARALRDKLLPFADWKPPTPAPGPEPEAAAEPAEPAE